jgi:hypothetical protein
MASVLLSQKREAEAEDLMRRAIAIQERGFGSQHPSYGLALRQFALILNRRGKSEEAEATAKNQSRSLKALLENSTPGMEMRCRFSQPS